MRRRLLTSTLTIVIATIALFGIPLGFVVDRVVHDEAQARLLRDAVRVARELSVGGVTTRPAATLQAELRRLIPTDDSLLVQYPGGRRVLAGATPPHALVARVGGPQGTTLTLRSPVDDVDTRVQHALLAIVVVAIVALGGALALSLVASRRLSGPLDRLARSAGRLGDGDFSLATPRSGVPEIDEIAETLDQSAARIERLLHAERSFTSYASHQLRSALTGLQLRLEELATSTDAAVRTEAEAALDQSTRLNAMIDELLALARTGRAGIVTRFDLAELAREHAGDIAALLGRSGREVVVEAPAPVTVDAAVGAFGHVLDILLSNAARHGRGRVTVRVYDSDGRARLEVEDEGSGFAGRDSQTLFEPREHDNGHGIGLVLARTLVVTEGGTLTLASARPPRLRVEVPRA